MPSIEVHLPSADRSEAQTSPLLPALISTPAGLAIIEIQGTVNFPAAEPGQTHIPLGKIVFPECSTTISDPSLSQLKKVWLEIGHQRLMGETKALDKPYGVMRRREAGSEEVEIAEVVRYKLLFKSRPEPLGKAD